MFFKTASSVHFSLPWNSRQSLSWPRTYISPTSFFKVLEIQVCHHTQQLCVTLRDDTICNRMWVTELAGISTLHTLPTTCHLAAVCSDSLLQHHGASAQLALFYPTEAVSRRTKDGCQRDATKYWVEMKTFSTHWEKKKAIYTAETRSKNESYTQKMEKEENINASNAVKYLSTLWRCVFAKAPSGWFNKSRMANS